MILQNSHVVVDCPVCGRPLEMSWQLVSHQIVCGHCDGTFLVVEKDDGLLATCRQSGTDPLKRAEELLLGTSDSDSLDSEYCAQQPPPLTASRNDKTGPDDSLGTLPKEAEREQKPQPTILLVEYRDEVFARVATDLAEFGARVVRAKTATEALILVETRKPVLIVGNVDLPGQSGWLMTAKLRLFDHHTRVWLYRQQPSNYGEEIAAFLDIDALLADHGDLFGLSDTIVDRMAHRRPAA